MEFREWLQNELNKREWRATDLAQRGNIDNGLVSRLLSGARPPSVEVLKKIASAFMYPVDDVFRHAGVLPTQRESQRTAALRHVAEQLEEEDIEELIQLARYKLQRRKNEVNDKKVHG